MKNFFLLLFIFVIIIALTSGVSTEQVNYRQEMRKFIRDISHYAKEQVPEFIIMTQNGQDLITETGDAEDAIKHDFLEAIDGTGRENLFYGYNNDNEKTPLEDHKYMLDLCRLYQENDIPVFTIDYCSTPEKIKDSLEKNQTYEFIPFVAHRRELDEIPKYPTKPFNVNDEDVTQLNQAKNFLYLINSNNFPEKTDFITAVSKTDYDVIIMDLFHYETAYTPEEVEQLKTKNNGGERLVLCYMSIGEAEDYRYYWLQAWQASNPTWLDEENPDWEGNYKVKYWKQDWQEIIYGDKDSYLNLIINVGFDGVYLDLIDAYEYFE